MSDLEGAAVNEIPNTEDDASVQDSGATLGGKDDLDNNSINDAESKVPPRRPYNSLPETTSSPVGGDVSGLTLPATGENLFDLLKDEKSLTGRLQKRISEIQNDLLQRSTSYEVELDNKKIEIISLKSKVRKLEKESKYPELFEEYEKQISSLTAQLKEMQQRCADAEAARDLSMNALSSDSNDKSQGGSASNIATLRREITVLKRHAEKARKKESEIASYKESFENAKKKFVKWVLKY